jgi:hypothetical protein
VNDEKVPELDIEQSEVEPLELPEGRRRAETGDQQDFGKDPRTGKDAPKAGGEAEEPEVPENDSGKFPRATKRRSHKEQMKQQKAQRAQMHKMQQEMQQPVRRRDLMGIYQQIRQFLIQPQIDKLQEQVDKLSLIPDFLGETLENKGIDLVTFEEYYEAWLEEKKKEEEELAQKEKEAKEAAAKAAAEKKQEEDHNTPETEEAQTE